MCSRGGSFFVKFWRKIAAVEQSRRVMDFSCGGWVVRVWRKTEVHGIHSQQTDWKVAPSAQFTTTANHICEDWKPVSTCFNRVQGWYSPTTSIIFIFMFIFKFIMIIKTLKILSISHDHEDRHDHEDHHGHQDFHDHQDHSDHQDHNDHQDHHDHQDHDDHQDHHDR